MGYVYAIGSAIAHAVMVICGKKVTVTGGLENSSIQMTVAFLMVFVYSIVISDLPTYVNGDDWLPILVLGVLNTGIGCFMYFLTIPKLEAQTISIWGYLEPLSALVAGMMFLGEQILVVQIAGVVLILFGTIGTGLGQEGTDQFQGCHPMMSGPEGDDPGITASSHPWRR